MTISPDTATELKIKGNLEMKILLRAIACLFVVVSSSSHAALYDRGNGLIYDDVLDITWLQDANYAQTSGYESDGYMNWWDASAWAAQLEYGGYDDWRLPSVGNTPTWGLNVTTGELGHMFYNNLSNTACTSGCIYDGSSILDNVSFTDATPGGGTESFLNVQSLVYWYGEEYAPATTHVWAFGTYDGSQDLTSKGNSTYSWAVHDGDIGFAPVPLPAGIYLFLSGLVGLGLMRGRNG